VVEVRPASLQDRPSSRSWFGRRRICAHGPAPQGGLAAPRRARAAAQVHARFHSRPELVRASRRRDVRHGSVARAFRARTRPVRSRSRRRCMSPTVTDARHARCSRSGMRGWRATVRKPGTRLAAAPTAGRPLRAACVVLRTSSRRPQPVRWSRMCLHASFSAYSARQLPHTARLRAAVGMLCLSAGVLLGFGGVTHVGRLGRTSVGAAAGCARHARESSPRHRQLCLGIWFRGPHGAKVSAHTTIDVPGASLRHISRNLSPVAVVHMVSKLQAGRRRHHRWSHLQGSFGTTADDWLG
jgi:hypothetical protein